MKLKLTAGRALHIRGLAEQLRRLPEFVFIRYNRPARQAMFIAVLLGGSAFVAWQMLFPPPALPAETAAVSIVVDDKKISSVEEYLAHIRRDVETGFGLEARTYFVQPASNR